MKLDELELGQRVYDADGTPLTVSGIGSKRVFCELGNEELSYGPDELFPTRVYPELTWNVYRPNPLDQEALPGRMFLSQDKAADDPKFDQVMLQIYLYPDGRVQFKVID